MFPCSRDPVAILVYIANVVLSIGVSLLSSYVYDKIRRRDAFSEGQIEVSTKPNVDYGDDKPIAVSICLAKPKMNGFRN